MTTVRTLVIMAKAPRPGSVKTRLADGMPADAIAELYRCLLEDTLAMVRRNEGVEIAVMCPSSDVDDLSNVLDGAVEIVPQSGQGLAAGLVSVFARFASAGRRVIALDSDSPHLPDSIVRDAFRLLEDHDLAVGPTRDGGYYLIGAKASVPALFEGDGMGTGGALELLLARARNLGLSLGFTERFYDIDVAADLVQLAAELRLAPGKAPRTAAWLSERASAWEPSRMRAEGS
jgi:rSAM/selenodomain-associated transferase 1